MCIHTSNCCTPFPCNKNILFLFAGFSFTNSTQGYARDQVQVGAELYSAIVQFLQLFPELQKVPFFITGESYAGRLNIDMHQGFRVISMMPLSLVACD